MNEIVQTLLTALLSMIRSGVIILFLAGRVAESHPVPVVLFGSAYTLCSFMRSYLQLPFLVVAEIFLLLGFGIFLYRVEKPRHPFMFWTAVLLPGFLIGSSYLIPGQIAVSAAPLSFESFHCCLIVFGMMVLNNLYRKNRFAWFFTLSVLMIAIAFGVPFLYLALMTGKPSDVRFIVWICVPIFMIAVLPGIMIIAIKNSKTMDSYPLLVRSKKEADTKNAAELEQLYFSIRKTNHEIRNHLSVIEQLIQEGKTEDSKKYLEEIRSSLSLPVVTGCPPFDAAIMLKENAFSAHSIRFLFEVCPLEHLSISATDLCALVNNLLDNALEACINEKPSDPYVELKVIRIRDMLFIRCQNPTKKDPTVIRDNSVRTNKDASIHGFGIPIMKEITERYHGTFELSIEDSHFLVRISLPLSES